MFGIGGFAAAWVVVVGLGLGAHAHLPVVPQDEVTAFCQTFGAGIHHATFFTQTGVGLEGHVNCAESSFTLSQILPPIEEETLASAPTV